MPTPEKAVEAGASETGASGGSGSLAQKVFRFGLHSGLYALTTVLTQGIQFFLVPLYTRVLTPADYGVLAVTTSLYGLVAIGLGLGLTSGIGRLYFEAKEQRDLGALCTTLLLFLVVVPGVATLLLDQLGLRYGAELFREAPFDPYLRLTLWSAWLSLFLNLPLGLYASAQRPRAVMALTVVSTLATLGPILYFVVVRREGALGSIRGQLLGNAAMAVVSAVLLLRMAPPRWSSALLRRSLLFALPFVPHLAGNWMINQSDRFVLAHWVTSRELGFYSLAAQISYGALAVVTAVNNAVNPQILSLLKRDDRAHVASLGTYAILVIAFATLAAMLLGNDLIRLVTPPSFHPAGEVVALLSLGYGFLGLYFVWSMGSWFSMRTRWVPVITLAASAVDLGLALGLSPRWGITGAAFARVVAYGLLAVGQGALAQSLHRIDWESGRWLRILIAASGTYLLASLIGPDQLVGSLAVRLVGLIVVFPGALLLSGFLRADERDWIRARLTRRPAASG